MRDNIGVIIPSYQHGKYIAETIRSVLQQTLKPQEVVIVDDCSTDNSVEVISKFKDRRIHLIQHPRNRGGAEALNTGLKALNTEFIAIINSDDIWKSDKLEKQYEHLISSDKIGAVFTMPETIDDEGNQTRNPAFLRFFKSRNSDRHQHLRRLFESRNFLCHPSILARKSMYDSLGLYDNRFRQLPDYHMWLRMLQKFEIIIIQEPLVKFRLHRNTSSPSPENSQRDVTEWRYIIDQFITKLDKVNFCQAFGSLRNPSSPEFSLPIEKIAYLTTIPGSKAFAYRDIASRMAFDLLSSDIGQQQWATYSLSESDLFTLTSTPTPLTQAEGELTLNQKQADLYFHLSGLRTRADLQ